MQIAYVKVAETSTVQLSSVQYSTEKKKYIDSQPMHQYKMKILMVH